MTRGRKIIAVMVAAMGPLALVILAKIPLGGALWVGAGTAVLMVLILRPVRPATAKVAAPVPVRQGSNAAQEVLGIIPDPVIVVGAQERVEFANPAACAIYPGFERGILLSLLVRHPEVLAVAGRARMKGLLQEVRFALRRPSERFLRVMALPLKAGRMALIFQDETELHRAEHMRAGFLANVSHELRTPLASLSGYIDTLSGHAKDDAAAQERFLAIMADQAARMGRLIDDLLSLSRIEMDAHLAPKTQVDLAAAMGDVKDALTPVFTARGVEVNMEPPSGPVYILGERDQVIQVIQNLIDNAVKYTPKGKSITVSINPDVIRQSPEFDQKALGETVPRLQIVEAPRDPGQRFAVLEVRDPGPGIPAEHLPRLGERFYRVEAGKTAERTGTGLGLAIVKHITNRHRGGFSVQSQPGAGTVFTVAFPLMLSQNLGTE
ncbi:MAG: histidine kinase [Robiginitomaculum sp.]|nr:MAG: histidine kinase [Robiginitomaculum sp.]